MATTKWMSSLANVETRLRRALGIAGPIGLELQDPPRLTPVVISEDATRPGTSSLLRGRRWKVSVAQGTIAAAARGSVWLYADGIYGSSGSSDPYAGGVIVDKMDYTCNTPGTLGQIMKLTMYAFPTPLVLNPGIPIVVSPNNAYFTDPTRTGSETAPVGCYGSATVGPETGGGIQIWRSWCRSSESGFRPVEVVLDMFLNWNSALVIGLDPTTVAPAGGCELQVNFHGRVF